MPSLQDVLSRPLPRRVPDVVVRMEEIEAALPRRDGVAAFTRLYRKVTEAVDARADPREFRDATFLRQLDVVFANLFFRALRAHESNARPPSAWAPLFDARRRRGIHPLQFAIAGMNAHINRDLPVALVRVCEQRGVAPEHGCPQYRDFCRVNALLRETEREVKRWFLTGVAGHADLLLGDADDAVAMWNVERAREAAWTNAEALWAIRRIRPLRTRFVRSLDRMVGLAGRGLLRPLA